MPVCKDIYVQSFRIASFCLPEGSTAHFRDPSSLRVSLTVLPKSVGVHLQFPSSIRYEDQEVSEFDLYGNEMNNIAGKNKIPIELSIQGRVFRTVFRYDGPKNMLANAVTIHRKGINY